MYNPRYTITIKFVRKFGEPKTDPIVIHHKTLSDAIEDYYGWSSCVDETIESIILVDNITKAIITPK